MAHGPRSQSYLEQRKHSEVSSDGHSNSAYVQIEAEDRQME